MRKVAFDTVGCRLNQYETEAMAAKLTACGFRRVNFDDSADLYIINTCTVTGRADASCRKSISQAGRNGASRVVVVGCMVSSDTKSGPPLKGVDLVVPNADKENIVDRLKLAFPDLFDNELNIEKALNDPGASDARLSNFYGHNRAWVKIGDGCNQNCSYCIVPKVRGRLINRSSEEIISEIRNLVANGYHEVVLTAVHVGQYKDSRQKSLGELLRAILSETKISRLRISSIEPQEVTTELLETMASAGDRVCRHLHIPLQSGSDKLLNDMHRPYTAEKYRTILHNARKAVDGITMGADVIVGFPGETDNDFQQTLDLTRSSNIDYLHVFSYSKREGTEASRYPDSVHPAIIKDRNKILRNVSLQKYGEALRRQIGTVASAISAHKADGEKHYWGITDNYLKIAIPYDLGGTKKIIKMSVTGATGKYLTGFPRL